MEEKCKDAFMLLRNYMCYAESSPYGNQSKTTINWELEGAKPFCLSKGIEQRVENPELKKLARI